MSHLSHIGLFCFDLQKMIDFYTNIIGLKITDADEKTGLTFLSSRPEIEHHEMLLAPGRDAPDGTRMLVHFAFSFPELGDVLAIHRRMKETGVVLDMIVTHGNAVSVYCYDPEGNRCEVFWPTGLDVRQPFGIDIDLDQPEEEIVRSVKDLVTRYSATGGGKVTRRSRTVQPQQS